MTRSKASLLSGVSNPPIIAALKGAYRISVDFNRFIESHIEQMRGSDNPTIERNGRILESANIGFRQGYIAPIVIIAAGQMLLGNPLSAVSTVGSAVIFSNPIAMTCAAIGAVYYGYNALSEDEKERLLLKLEHGLGVGVELVKAVIAFVIKTIKDLFSKENLLELKRLMQEGAALFGKHLSEITRSIADRVTDGALLVRDAAEKAAVVTTSAAKAGYEFAKEGGASLTAAAGRRLSSPTRTAIEPQAPAEPRKRRVAKATASISPKQE